MKIGEIKRRISKQIRKQYEIKIDEKDKVLNYNGYDYGQYLSIPFNKINAIENNRVVITIKFQLGNLSLWKKVNNMHLTLFFPEA